jgi:hypothetical protein
MDAEYHYYITYLIAILSGFKLEEAYKIAYSSQYVDDNCLEYNIYSAGSDLLVYRNLVSAIQDIRYDLNKMTRILLAFHFLPGDKNNIANRKDGKKHMLNTTKNSKLAKLILRTALNSRNLYWIGIATHAYVDTWAHQNFVGTLSEFNGFTSYLGKMLPNIGHLDVLDKPDLVGLIWKDLRLNDEVVKNPDRFLDASKKLMIEYVQHTKCRSLRSDEFLHRLNVIMMNYGKNNYIDAKRLKAERIKKYNDLAKEFSLFDILKYNKNEWRHHAIKKMKYGQLCWKKNDFHKNYDWYKFQEAVKLHYEFVSMCGYATQLEASKIKGSVTHILKNSRIF